MKGGLIYVLVALFNVILILNLTNRAIASPMPPSSHDSNNNQLKRAAFDSLEENEDFGDDSIEYSELGPAATDLRAYLYGRDRRSLKKGFNAWAGRRGLEHFYKRLINEGGHHHDLLLASLLQQQQQHQPAAAAGMQRERRKPWGGSA